MKKLYFVRHGESEANLREFFAGQWDTPLTKLGREQARNVANDIKKIKVDLIVSSSLSRAKDTAEIIAFEIGYPTDKIVISKLFMERNYGELANKPYSHSEGLDFELVPGMETTPQLIKRAQQAASYLKSLDHGTILLVGHGTFGRMVRDQLQNQITEVEVPIWGELANGEVIRWL